MPHRAPDNDLGMILGLAFLAVGCFFLVYGLFQRRDAEKANGGVKGQGPGNLVVLRGWPPVFARIWLVLMGISMMGWGSAAFVDNLIYADTHHHQSGVGVVFWPTFAICLGSGAVFVKASAVPNMKGVGLLFYRLMGLVFVCVGVFGVFLIVGAGPALWCGLLSYISDIQRFIATGQPIA